MGSILELATRWVVTVLIVTAAATCLFTLATYTQRWWLRAPTCDGGDDRLGLINVLAALAREWAALTAVVLLWPLGAFARRNRAERPAASIILLHGWGLNAASFWWLRAQLRRRGYGPVSIFRYRTRGVPIEAAAEQLRQLLARQPATQPITLIGHSLGGLVGRYYLRRYPSQGVRRLITLGTPHQGTRAAWRLLGVGRLQPAAPLITRLNAGDHVPDQVEVVAISSPFDALVVPSRGADYPGACNIAIQAVGHHALLFSPRVVALITETLGPPSRA